MLESKIAAQQSALQLQKDMRFEVQALEAKLRSAESAVQSHRDMRLDMQVMETKLRMAENTARQKEAIIVEAQGLRQGYQAEKDARQKSEDEKESLRRCFEEERATLQAKLLRAESDKQEIQKRFDQERVEGFQVKMRGCLDQMQTQLEEKETLRIQIMQSDLETERLRRKLEEVSSERDVLLEEFSECRCANALKEEEISNLCISIEDERKAKKLALIELEAARADLEAMRSRMKLETNKQLLELKAMEVEKK
jgi:hypothetical protein